MKIPFAKHLGTKLMALVLAVFLWGFAYLENLKEESITYRLSISAPAGLKIDKPTRPIDVVVRGPRKIVEPLSGELEVYIKKEITEADIESFGDADTIHLPIRLTAQDFNANPALTFPNLPRPVQVTLRRIDTRMLPVRLRVTGEPKPGYVYSREDSYPWPRSVSVTGPKSMLDKAQQIETEEIDISGLSASFKASEIRLENRIDGELVRIGDDRVDVYITIEQQLEEKSVEVRIEPMAPLDYPYAHSPDRTTVTVTLRGPGEVISGLRAEDVLVFYRVDDTMDPDDVPYPVDLAAWVPAHPDVTATLEQDLVNVKVEAASP